MKRIRRAQLKKLAVVCLACCMVMTWGGCGASSKSYDSAASVEMPRENYSSAEMGGGYYTEETIAEEVDMEMADTTADTLDSNGAATNRKLIKTVDMNVETKEFDLVMSTIETQVSTLGGYIENMETYNGSTYSGYRSVRNASMTIRIPKDKLNGFLETVSEISNVVRRSENVEDVTLAYVDIESRRNALQTEQDRLLELLGRAESIEDIITIEERLSHVRYELESMESQLRTYDNKVDYSTVYLYIDEVQELTPIVEETAWQRMTGGFVESIQNIGNGAAEICIWLVVHSPYFILYAVFVTVVILIVKTISKRSAAKQQKKENPKQ